jgi:hypothetical protein
MATSRRDGTHLRDLAARGKDPKEPLTDGAVRGPVRRPVAYARGCGANALQGRAREGAARRIHAMVEKSLKQTNPVMKGKAPG